MRWSALVLVALVVGAASAALAQEEAVASCDQDGVIDRQCLRLEVERLDAELDEVLAAIRSELRRDLEQAEAESNPELDEPPGLAWYQRRVSNFERTQQAWLAFRAAACDEAHDSFSGGSLAGPAWAYCMIDTTQARIRQVKGMYDDVIEDP